MEKAKLKWVNGQILSPKKRQVQVKHSKSAKKIARINTYPRSLNYGGAVDFFFFDSL